jgi:D-alanyl-lipoteichoic acid acyltransferase DltB (MBOAT superfamily)
MALFDVRFVAVIYATILLNYAVGLGLANTDVPRQRKALVAASIAGQLGMLGFFKYADFFRDAVSDVFDAVGLEFARSPLSLILPVGISFYSFQTLAYVINVYRREQEAERDLVTFATFAAWFPQTVAGPIERPTSLLTQLRRRRERPSADTVASALTLILTGLFKKVVIADGIAAYVATVYSAPGSYGWSTLLLAAAGFAIQVYGDFSGYTDMARGVSRLLGVELRRNFEQPFLSRDIREFWTRWHTSLNWWFVEYVGRPLGGAGGTPLRAARTTLVIFALIGFWHGAALHFVVWGLLNGALVVIWRTWIPAPKRRHPMRVVRRDAPGIALTFALFALGAVFFRIEAFGDAVDALWRMVSFKSGLAAPAGAALVPVVMLVVLLLDLDERRRRISTIERLRVRAALGSVPNPQEAIVESAVDRLTTVRCVAFAAMIVAIVVFSGGAPTPFIYRQF